MNIVVRLVPLQVVVKDDEGIRPGTTAERLAKLKPSFTEAGTTTAGNSSQVSVKEKVEVIYYCQ